MRSQSAAGLLAQVIAEAYQGRRTGAIRLQRGPERLRLFFREGRIVDIDSRAEERVAPDADDAQALALHQIFEGLGKRQRRPGLSPGRRERLLAALCWPGCSCTFEEGATPAPTGPGIGISTEQLIAEVVRRMGPPAVRAALGDEDRVLVRVDAAPGPEPLTPAGNALLGRVDGALPIGALLDAAAGPREEAERTLLCLVLRGLVAELAPPAEAAAGADPEGLGGPAFDPEILRELRREIQKGATDLDRKSHFEVLGVPEVTSPAGIDEAYRRLSRLLDDAARAGPALADLRADVEALRLRIDGAHRVLSGPQSRAAYEGELTRRTQEAARAERSSPRALPNWPEAAMGVDERVEEAEHLLAREQCWDAMQILERLLPMLPRGPLRRRVRILLAQACLRNPKWARRAEDLLQSVVSEDPSSVDAYAALGSLYKARGLPSRAASMFRKVRELAPGHPAATLELGSRPLQKLLGRQ